MCDHVKFPDGSVAWICEPDVDGDGSLGCPLPDCGGIATEVEAKKP